jgi:hypothetical protein
VCDELTVVRAVIHAITLKEGEELLLGRNRGHDTLGFRIIRAAEALD